MNCIKKTLSYLSGFLKFISVGKYKPKFYYKKSRTYSSVIGGLITLIIGGILGWIAIDLLVNCFLKKNMTYSDSRVRFWDWPMKNSILRDLMKLGLVLPEYEIKIREIFNDT